MNPSQWNAMRHKATATQATTTMDPAGMETTVLTRSNPGMGAQESAPPTVTGRQKTSAPMSMILMGAGWEIGAKIRVLGAALNLEMGVK